MSISLDIQQIDAVNNLKNGSILCADVGCGKSRTAIAYYFLKVCQGEAVVNGKGSWGEMKTPRDLYIITTAKKRDSKEWIGELVPFMISDENGKNFSGVKVVVDSWNNISKYKNVYGAFFIFDEQRVVGHGQWVKAFLNITRKNKWILLSATPGDTWSDYIPVFVANGFYKNRTEFLRRHAVFNRFAKYPKIDRYVETGHLLRLRNQITVQMKMRKQTVPHHEEIICSYDAALYKRITKDRWDIYKNEPIQEAGKLCYLMRKIVNSDDSRTDRLLNIFAEHSRLIVFYNFDYELEILRNYLDSWKIQFSEWNGKRHEKIPDGEKWVYLVQYSAGSEGWNCIDTDTIVFYSQNYSYRTTVQAAGRIDRRNTPFTDLYFFHLTSKSGIDLAIKKALSNKKNFNEKTFVGSKEFA